MLKRIVLTVTVGLFVLGLANQASAVLGQPIRAGAMPGTLIVRFRPQAGKAARAAVHDKLGSSRVHSFRLISAEVVRIPAGGDRDAIAASYAARPDVDYVQPNFVYTIHAIPDDRKFGRQWNLRQNIHAVEAWNHETGDRAVVVSVLDTGIDYNHPDLRDNMWTNEIERNGALGVDDDGNSIVDDIYGARFIDGTGIATDSDPFDDHFHGTHVAGIIGATGNNHLGIAGINHTMRLMAVKPFNHWGRGYTADVIAALEYAVAMGAQVTNASWGGNQYDQALRDAIEAAGRADHLFIAAAGNNRWDNDSYSHYPSNYSLPNIIAVASTTRADVLSDFSSFGLTTVDIAAPGSDILSTFRGDGYRRFSGTSMAAPHVTGVAALLLAYMPGARAWEVKELLLDGADHLQALDGYVAGGRRLNANGALLGAAPSAGRVSFERTTSACGLPLTIQLRDMDLAQTGAVDVTVTGFSGDVESVQLSETTTPSLFRGTIATRSDGVVAPDGLLAVLHGYDVSATYEDADDGTGVPGTDVGWTTLDCIPAQVSNVRVSEVNGLGATIEFDASEPAFGQVRYGTACGQLTGMRRNSGDTMAQRVDLSGLTPETQYFFVVEVVDAAGTVTRDDNSGACYEFTTLFLQDYFTYDSGYRTSEGQHPLVGQSITFTPDGSRHFYASCREPTTALLTDPTGGTPWPPEPNVPRIFEVILENAQRVWLYGESYDRFYVSRYGSVTFDAPDPEDHLGRAQHFSQPRVTALGQAHVRERGWVSVKQLPDRAVVTYQNARNYGDRQESNAQLELFFDGRIRITVLSVGSSTVLTGLSAGGGLPADFVSSDLRATPSCGTPDPPAVPISGRRLKFKYEPYGSSEHKFWLNIVDDALHLPAPGTAADPTVNAPSLVLFNPSTGERDTYYLPTPYWQHYGAGYLYKEIPDRGTNVLTGKHLSGPCYKLRLTEGRLIARCKGESSDGIHFSLDEPGGQGTLAAMFTTGAGANTQRYCAVFGGRVRKDRWWEWTRKAEFNAVKAPPPAECPPLP